MERELIDPTDAFEPWLQPRMAEAGTAGEGSAGRLTERRIEMERARELPQEKAHGLAVQDIAEPLGHPLD